MKKIYISIPMKGRTDENIKASFERIKVIVEAMLGEPVEVIDTFLEGGEYTDRPVALLGESIKRMQDADIVVTTNSYYEYGGCHIERTVARNYGKKIIEIEVDHIKEFDDVFKRMYQEPQCYNTPSAV